MERNKGLRNGLILSLTVIISFVLGVLSPMSLTPSQKYLHIQTGK